MMEKKIKDIVSNLTEQVVSKLKQEDSLNESIPVGSGLSTNPYLKLTQVKNGYILELNSENPAEPPETEVIEIDDEQIEYRFSTAWGPPEGVIEKLREQYPDIEITAFYDEPGMEIAGYY